MKRRSNTKLAIAPDELYPKHATAPLLSLARDGLPPGQARSQVFLLVVTLRQVSKDTWNLSTLED